MKISYYKKESLRYL